MSDRPDLSAEIDRLTVDVCRLELERDNPEFVRITRAEWIRLCEERDAVRVERDSWKAEGLKQRSKCNELETERDEVKRALEMSLRDRAQFVDLLREARDERDELRTSLSERGGQLLEMADKRDVMRKALKPFVEATVWLEADEHDDPDHETVGPDIAVSHWLKAREVAG